MQSLETEGEANRINQIKTKCCKKKDKKKDDKFYTPEEID